MKKKQILIGILLVAAVLVIALVLMGRQGETVEPVETTVPDMMVETPYGTLYFPGQWQDQVRTEVIQEETVTVRFHGKTSGGEEAPLFDVIFGAAEGEILGMIHTDTETECPVSVFVYEPDPMAIPAEKDVYEFNALQEDINYLISKLPLENVEQYVVPQDSQVVAQNSRPAVYADVELETPWATVTYPGELAGQLHVEVLEEEPGLVTFSWNHDSRMIHLFEISFGGEEGLPVGVLEESGRPVYLTVFDLALEEGLTSEELDTAYSLQEALNDVLANLPMEN